MESQESLDSIRRLIYLIFFLPSFVLAHSFPSSGVKGCLFELRTSPGDGSLEHLLASEEVAVLRIVSVANTPIYLEQKSTATFAYYYARWILLISRERRAIIPTWK
jgi:hypothetical protein